MVSGVNHGYNAGSDVLYSGTVAAAMEGALEGRPAMAVSLAGSREDTYDRAAQTALRVFDVLREKPLPPLCVLNLNYPGVDDARGIKAAPLKRMRYTDVYAQERGEAGECLYHLRGNVDETVEEGEDDFTLAAPRICNGNGAQFRYDGKGCHECASHRALAPRKRKMLQNVAGSEILLAFFIAF